MGFAVDLEKSNIEVIVKFDEAVADDITDEEYSSYLLDLDEAKLRLKPGVDPTKFVLRKVLPYSASQRIKSMQMKYKGGDVEVNTGYIMEEVRCSLVDIKNPASMDPGKCLTFKKDADGYCAKSIVEILEAANVLQSLYLARVQANNSHKRKDDLSKKN